MKVVIPGGSGQIGTILARHFHEKGDEVVVLSRQATPTAWRIVHWDGQTLGEWVNELEEADVLINLTGKSVNCRYNWKNRCEIWSSRTRSVRVLGRALSEIQSPPPVWLQASTATIYVHRFDAPNNETTGIIGGLEGRSPDTWRFSIDVARSWEGEFTLIETPRTRRVALRSAMTMSHDRNGIFDYLLWLVRIGLGGTVGSGNQFVSWIHYLDFIRAIEWLIEHEEIEGVVNVCSPNPIPNKEFMRQLRAAWRKSWGIPIYEWMLEIGAVLLQTESELVLKSRNVVPGLLLSNGFQFGYSQWNEAAADLCRRWRAASE